MIEEIAPCDPTGKYRKILNAILKDEMEHQEYLLKVLVDMDAFIPEDVSTAMAEMNALGDSPVTLNRRRRKVWTLIFI